MFCLRYHEAGSEAKAKVLELLRGLSAELQAKINVLVFASMLLVISKALFAHVRSGILYCSVYFYYFLVIYHFTILLWQYAAALLIFSVLFTTECANYCLLLLVLQV